MLIGNDKVVNGQPPKSENYETRGFPLTRNSSAKIVSDDVRVTRSELHGEKWHQQGLWSITTLFLSGLVVFSTSFDYIWLGPFPAWLAVVIVGLLFGVLFFSKHRLSTVESFRAITTKILVPAIVFMLIALIIDVGRGSFATAFSKRFLLNGSVLLALLAATSWAMHVARSFIIHLLALIALVQGMFCIAQFLGSTEAWDFASKLANAYGKVDQDEMTNATFALIQRAKGTSLYIHKFTPMQGIIVTFLLTAGIMNFQQKNPLKLKMYFMLPAVTIGLVGMILTFSRSVILGLVISLALLILSQRNFKVLFAVLVMGGSLVLAESYVNIGGGKEFNRLTDVSMSRTTNASRKEHLKYALESFSNSPIFGTSAVGIGHTLVHSVPLRILVEYGLMGLIPYLVTFIGIYRFFRSEQKLNYDIPQVTILTKASIYALIVGLVDSSTHSSGFLIRDVTQGMLFGLFAGMVKQSQFKLSTQKALI